MGVIIDPLLVGRPLVDGDPAARAVEQFLDRAVGRRDHRRPFAGHDVDRVVAAAGAARLVISVDELVGLYADDRQGEARRARPHLLREDHRRRLVGLDGDHIAAARHRAGGAGTTL